jgi:hypothetical protein
MKKLLLAAATALAFAPSAFANDDDHRARLSGFQEVPVVSTVGSGRLKLEISKDEQSIHWDLTYQDIQATVTQAHIHAGQKGVNGGIVLWFCGTTLNVPGVANTPGPAGTQVCTSPDGHFTGTFTGADVQTVATQQFAPGELDEVIAAIRAGVAYGNVHSLISPAGEIRGQIRDDDKRGKHRGHHGHDD